MDGVVQGSKHAVLDGEDLGFGTALADDVAGLLLDALVLQVTVVLKEVGVYKLGRLIDSFVELVLCVCVCVCVRVCVCRWV